MESNQRILAIRGKDMDDKRLLFEVFNEGADWQCEGEVDEVQKTNEGEEGGSWDSMDYVDNGYTGGMDIEDTEHQAD